jgi:hypothetical protein
MGLLDRDAPLGCLKILPKRRPDERGEVLVGMPIVVPVPNTQAQRPKPFSINRLQLTRPNCGLLLR